MMEKLSPSDGYKERERETSGRWSDSDVFAVSDQRGCILLILERRYSPSIKLTLASRLFTQANSLIVQFFY